MNTESMVAALQYAAEQGAGKFSEADDDSDLVQIEVTVGWLREVLDALKPSART